MSVQLIVYPQNYNGQATEISSSSTEFVVNGINFSNLGSATAYTSSAAIPYSDTLINSPATIPNTWYIFINNVGGTPAYPSVVTGSLVLESLSGGVSGVYQRLTNLVIGQQYTITINLDATTGVLVTQYASGTNIFGGGSAAATVTQITDTFTAQSTTDTVMIVYVNPIDATVTITDLSVQPVVGAVPSGATNVLDDGQVILDLYEDEDLPLTLSVDNFKNVAEKVQSYSKAFNLPATKRNNIIFDQMFEVTRSDDGIIFNAYKKTKCILKQDGFILFEGYLRMLDATNNEGEISYNVNLYSEVVALADTLKDRTFRDLDFNELNHDYDYDNIKLSATGDLILIDALPSDSFAGAAGTYQTGVLKYPFVDWVHQYTLDSGNPILQNLETSFRPFINAKYIIDNIFADTEFTYSSSFFNTTEFSKLFMDFNWGSEGVGAVPVRSGGLTQAYNTSAGDYWFGSSYTKFKLQDNISGNPLLWDNTDYKFVSDVNNLEVTADYYLKLQNDTGSSRGNSVRIAKFSASGSLIETFAQNHDSIGGNLTKTFQGTFTTVLQIGEYIQAHGKTPTSPTIRISMSGTMSNIDFVYNTDSSKVVPLLYNIRGELGQWDFLKGLITMFNLVSMPDEDNPNNIIIEPFQDIFITPSLTVPPLNWTDKIDVSKMKLEPLTDLNRKTIFKFVEDEDDFPFNNYKNSVGGHLYGSKKYNAGNEFNILEGTDEVVAEPFAATLVKPLDSYLDDFIVPSIYSYDKTADTTESFENSPRLMYDNGVKTLSYDTFSVPAQNGVAAFPTESQFLQFSHFTNVPTTSVARDFHFGECQLMTGVGAPTSNNLFNLYWLPYYAELYNPNTRIMTLKVNLSPADINTFKFNATVLIKNRIFRVNKIDYKPNDLATVEFILIP